MKAHQLEKLKQIKLAKAKQYGYNNWTSFQADHDATTKWLGALEEVEVEYLKWMRSETNQPHPQDSSSGEVDLGVIITGITPGVEGVQLHLNKKASLKGLNVKNTSCWVSWDKIGQALIHGYTKAISVEDRNEIRNNTPTQPASESLDPLFKECTIDNYPESWGGFGRGVIKICLLRHLEYMVSTAQISYSRMVEILNEWVKPEPSESLEQAAESYIEVKSNIFGSPGSHKKAFKAGAEWQSTQQQKPLAVVLPDESSMRKMAKKACNGSQHAMRYQNMLRSCMKMGELMIEEIRLSAANGVDLRTHLFNILKLVHDKRLDSLASNVVENGIVKDFNFWNSQTKKEYMANELINEYIEKHG